VLAFSAFIISGPDVDMPEDDTQMGTITLKITGNITWTSAEVAA
jgi:hypothetical protein